MKRILYVVIVGALIFTACQKQVVDKPAQAAIPPAYLSVVQKYVRQHVSNADYNNIDFNRYRISKQKIHWYIRLSLKNESMASDFVLLQTDSLGNTVDGKFIHIERTNSKQPGNTHGYYNGFIEISSLDKKRVIHSAITNGYIEAWHPGLIAKNLKGGSAMAKAESFPVPYDELPEVVVVAYRPATNEGSSFSFADYMVLESMFESASGSSAYSDGDYGGATTYSYAGSYGDPDQQTAQYEMPGNLPDITLIADDSWQRPQIDLDAWLKCFTGIPDAGARCSIALLGDLPVETDPSIGLNIWNGNTGHCFLQLKKSNGVQTVTQIIGFTAQSAGQSILNPDAFFPGKTVDNAGHKYNCSISMDLTAYGMNTVMDKMKSLAGRPYSIVNYDCLDWALEVFNSVRPGNPLIIPKIYDPNDPFSNTATGPKLFELLEGMLTIGSPEAGNITIYGSWKAGLSHGPCY